MIHKGSCLCGKVNYEIHDELTGVLNCHCSDCRNAHGAAFRTRATVQSKDFDWVTGEELVSHYGAAPGEFRTFCSICGSNLITNFSSNPEVYGFALGTLDTDPGLKPECHVFVSDKDRLLSKLLQDLEARGLARNWAESQRPYSDLAGECSLLSDHHPL